MDPEVGALTIFGPGVNAIIRGNDLYVYGCEEQQYQIRKTTLDYQDIPVWYTHKNGSRIEAFLDSLSYKEKETSISYPTYGILPIGYNIGGVAKCSSGGNLISCGQPHELGTDFEHVKKNLDRKAEDVSTDGGFEDRETRDAYRAMVDADSDLEADEHSIGTALYSPERVNSSMFSLVNLGDLTSTIFNASFFGSWLDYIVKGGAVVSILITVLLVFLRCRKLRRSKSDEFRNSYLNHWYAVANAPMFHSEYHNAEHGRIKQKLTSFKEDLHNRPSAPARIEVVNEHASHDSVLSGQRHRVDHTTKLYPDLSDPNLSHTSRQSYISYNS